MKGRGIQIVLVVIVLSLLAFGVRTWRLEAKGVSQREIRTLYRAQLSLPDLLLNQTVHPSRSAADLHPPLYFLLLAAFTHLVGESDFALRFLSVAWTLPLVPLLYVTGVRFWNRRAGVIAAVLGSLSPLYLSYAQQARMHTMAMTLGLLAVYALDRALDEGHTGWLVAAAVGGIAAVCTHYLGLLFLVVLGVQALLGARRAWRLPMALTSLGVATAGLLALGFAASRLGPSREASLGYPPLGARATDALQALILGPISNGSRLWPVGPMLLALFLLGTLWPARRKRQVLLGVYFAVALLAMYVARLVWPLSGASDSLMLVSPALYLGVAWGLERITRRLWPVGLVVGIVVLGGMGLAMRDHFRRPRSQPSPDYRAVAQRVQLYERPGDVIVINAPEDAIAFRHYYQGRLPAITLPPAALCASQDQIAIERATASVASRFARVWLVSDPARACDPHGYVEGWLERGAFLIEAVSDPSHGVDEFLRLYLTNSPILKQIPPHQHSQQVSFGSLRLEGYDLPLHPVSGGERAWITLYWRTLYSRDARVSLRLVDEQERQWTRADEVHYPAFPPQQWPIGSIVRQEASILVPPAVPPGWYRLELRLYNRDTGRPIEPLLGAEVGPFVLGPLRIESTWASRTSLRRLAGARHVLLGTGMRFGGTVALRALGLGTRTVRPAEWLHVDLYWQVEQPPDRDLTLTLELADVHGTVIYSERGLPVSDQHPPASWRAGELLWTQHELLVPATARPGLYRLRLNMRDASGMALPIRNQWYFWSWGREAAFVDSVRVVEPPRAFNWPPMDHVLAAQNTVGIDLLGFDGVWQRLGPGDELEVTLLWRAVVVPTKSYKVSIQLLASDQRTILAQDDSIPAQWTRPTTGWSLGEIIRDEHRVAIPAEVPSQMATLIVALYDEDTGRRAQWLEDDQLQEYVTLCSVEIVD